jgi:hypothetical protein
VFSPVLVGSCRFLPRRRDVDGFAMSSLTTESDIERARADPVFHQQLLTRNLERLLAALNDMRKNNNNDPVSLRQIREGADLAVKLADRLHRQTGPNAA